MAPRVQYVGPVETAAGRMHEYTDGTSSWNVPETVPQVAVPDLYRHKVEAEHETQQGYDPDVLEALRQQYSGMAAATRAPNEGNPLPPPTYAPDGRPVEYRGISRPRFADAVPREQLTDRVLQGPRPDGSSLAQVQPQRVPTDVALQLGEGRDTLEHEGLHVAAYNLAPRDGRPMSPREQQDWHVTAANAATSPATGSYSSPDKRHHLPHEAHELERAERAEKFMTDLQQKLGL
jgi:hypothetical protein